MNRANNTNGIINNGMSEIICKLDDLLPALLGLLVGASQMPTKGISVRQVVMDSRQAGPGALFVAVKGETSDGHRYIQNALERGAAAIIGTQPIEGLPAPYFQVTDSRLALARVAAAFYGYPARKMTMIGVTGTDGKTTTSNLIFSILKAAGFRTGMISTVNAVIGEEILDTGFHVTTPDAPDIQSYLHRMAMEGSTHCVLEATSHGLAQGRVEACDFDLAAVTNITHEHLDYHGSYEAYREAKGKLFSSLSRTLPKTFKPPRGAALNRDDRSYDYLAGITQVQALTYGLGEAAQVRARQVSWDQDGVRFRAEGLDCTGETFDFPIYSRLAGGFNVSNCLAAITLCRGLLRLDDAAVQRGIADLPGVPGRMERINLGQPFTAIVDFAHTPNALKRALEAAREMVAADDFEEMGGNPADTAPGRRVIAVFGSAGLRDHQKRRMMAETSAELADLSVLTAEDPRTESLAAILAEMAAGAESRGGRESETFWRIPDRREAIRFALQQARPGDLVIVCGKGHEQSMCFGTVEYPWDDRIAMRAALSEMLGIDGPEMPALPQV